ncbi:hypothetical protein BGX33_006512 [Mortierella sp. NVP41]|nr:hypothetical protein BGX33_006512 [Mortierella sp. NVP41]
MSLLPLAQCHRLKTLRIRSPATIAELPQTLPRLNRLKSLGFRLTSHDQAEYLSSAAVRVPVQLEDDDQDGEDTAFEEQAVLPQLEHFEILSVTIDNTNGIVLTSQLGRVIGISLNPLPDNISAEDRVAQWRATYTVLGDLRSLKVMAIRGSHFFKSNDLGFQ